MLLTNNLRLPEAIVRAVANDEYTRGDAMNPHSREALRNKFFEIAGMVWDEALVTNVFDGVMACENISDVHAFFSRHAI